MHVYGWLARLQLQLQLAACSTLDEELRGGRSRLERRRVAIFPNLEVYGQPGTITPGELRGCAATLSMINLPPSMGGAAVSVSLYASGI